MTVMVLLFVTGCRIKEPLPPSAEKVAYSGKRACIDCHAAEGKLWSESDHDKAMAVADSTNVLGRFINDSLVTPGGRSDFHKRGGDFFVRMRNPGGDTGEYKIAYTFGVRPLQQYLVAFPGGRLQCLPTAWDTKQGRWFNLDTANVMADNQADHKADKKGDKKLPDDWLHWTRDGQNWNGMCSDCHSTGLIRGYSIEKETFHTTWKEINVTCEACHGPGGEHVRWANANVLSKWFSGHGTEDAYGLAAMHKHEKADREIAACARCHARRMALKRDYGYSPEFLDEYLPELLTENVYHADGQIQDEDYEYGSFLQSKMYHKGVRCSDCHDPHSLKVKAPGNALCTRCHEAARFDVETHHHHPSGSAGSLCVNCHMPGKNYMQVDFRRDHSLRLPRPDLSVRYGVPNACNTCHADKPASWAADWVIKWHGPDRKRNFADLLAKGRSQSPGADSALSELALGPQYPAIARATGLSLLSAYMNDLARSTLLAGVRDSEPLVRQAAATGLQEYPQSDRITAVSPLLRDSLRAVRIAAANTLASIAPMIGDSMRIPYRSALLELREMLAANAYFPGGRFNLGQLYDKVGLADSAVGAYAAALRIDNRFIPARTNLAHLQNRLGNTGEAENQFRTSIRITPEYPEAYYELGLLLAGKGELDSAERYLRTASVKIPGNPRVDYNLGLVLQKMGKRKDAEAALLRALHSAGEDPEYLYTLAWFHSLNGEWEKVRPFLSRLAVVAPSHPGLEALSQALSKAKVKSTRRNR